VGFEVTWAHIAAPCSLPAYSTVKNIFLFIDQTKTFSHAEGLVIGSVSWHILLNAIIYSNL
jgi:hypothetical protein